MSMGTIIILCMDSPGGWIGEGGLPLPAKAVMALQAEEVADRAEERQRQREREIRAEYRQQLAVKNAMLRDQAAGRIRAPQEILNEEQHGRPISDVLGEAAEKMEREDARERRQAWLRGEGGPPPEVLVPPEPAPATSGTPKVPTLVKLAKLFNKHGRK